MMKIAQIKVHELITEADRFPWPLFPLPAPILSGLSESSHLNDENVKPPKYPQD